MSIKIHVQQDKNRRCLILGVGELVSTPRLISNSPFSNAPFQDKQVFLYQRHDLRPVNHWEAERESSGLRNGEVARERVLALRKSKAACVLLP